MSDQNTILSIHIYDIRAYLEISNQSGNGSFFVFLSAHFRLKDQNPNKLA